MNLSESALDKSFQDPCRSFLNTYHRRHVAHRWPRDRRSEYNKERLSVGWQL